MVKPQVPIDVDAQTGIWCSDGLPMLYVPRHFFNNLHLGIEQMVGREQYRRSLYRSGHTSAWFWCNQTAREHNLEPVACYAFYLQRLSQRGWGRFSFNRQALAQGSAEILVRYSSFVLHKQQHAIESDSTDCYMFEGWFAGAADWVSEQFGWGYTFLCREHTCAGQAESTHATDCCFHIERQ